MEKLHLKLNQILADSSVLYTKLHNYHWNIKGVHFFGIHQKTEELYNYVSILYDDVAERILQLNGKPLVTLKEILNVSRIKEEENSEFDVKHVAQNMIEDFKFLVGEFKQLSEIADNDATTQAFADEKAAYFEKEIWMLSAFSK